jgi:catechol 2,3-dioxygenase-like lactoylglutathione lyase family enzyme
MALLFNEIEFILYVSDQERSTAFYSDILEIEPVLHVPGMTEFQLLENVKLGLMPEKGIVRILENKITNPATANGIARCELYLKTDDIQKKYRDLIQKGIEILKTPAEMNWGDTVFYLTDPDGHIIAFTQQTKN